MRPVMLTAGTDLVSPKLVMVRLESQGALIPPTSAVSIASICYMCCMQVFFIDTFHAIPHEPSQICKHNRVHWNCTKLILTTQNQTTTSAAVWIVWIILSVNTIFSLAWPLMQRVITGGA